MYGGDRSIGRTRRHAPKLRTTAAPAFENVEHVSCGSFRGLPKTPLSNSMQAFVAKHGTPAQIAGCVAAGTLGHE